MLPQLLPQQRAREIADADVGVGVILHLDLAIDRPHRLFLDHVRRTVAEVHVGSEASEVEHEIGLVHPRDNRRRTDRADVHAHVQRMVHRERALAEHGSEHGRAHLLSELDQILRCLEAVNLDTSDQYRLAALVEHRGGFMRRFLDLARIGFLEVQATIPFDQVLGDFDFPIDHVAMNLDVAGPLLGPDAFHDAM